MDIRYHRYVWAAFSVLLLPMTAEGQGEFHSFYSGGVSMVGGESRCTPGSWISVTIAGPTHYPSWAETAFTNGENVNGYGHVPPCGGGGALAVSSGTGLPGNYVFFANYPGFFSYGRVPGATCSTQPAPGVQGYCSGGFGTSLWPTDNEPLEPRMCTVANAPGSANAPNGNAGAPVNLLTGNVWFDQTDTSIPGIGPGLRLVRSYNSLLANRAVGGAFGRGWLHIYEQSLGFPAGDLVKLRSADGSPLWFEDFDGNGTYAAMLPRLETSWIVRSGSSPSTVWTRHFRSGASEVYDAAGHLTRQSDPMGNGVTLTYDPSGRLETVTEDSMRSLTFAYDANDRIVSLSGPAGVIASYEYDVNGYLQTVGYPDGSGYTFTYDSAARVLTVLDAGGRTVETHTYDAAGRGITSSRGDGQETFTIYYMMQNTIVADARGNVTDYEWTSIEGASARITKITGSCTACGGASGGRTQSWTYDSKGSILSYTNALGAVSTFTYDANGNLLTETTPVGVTTYTYDSQDRILTAALPGGGLTTYTYISNAGPHTVTEKVTATQDRTTTLTYTSTGKVETITDPRGKTTTLAYGAFGDLETVTDPLTHATTFEYDDVGRRTVVTDALSHTTTTEYDPRGRVTRITDADDNATEFRYDASGLRTAAMDALGRTTTYRYDDHGRQRSVVDALGGTTEYGYDQASNLVSLTDARGKTTGFSYDVFGRVSVVIYPGGGQETFTYDDAGRLSQRRDRKNVTTAYAYNSAGRLISKSYSDSTPTVTYTYDSAGRLATAGNGTDTLTWTYDFSGQLLSEQSSKNSSTVAYAYDLAGNRLTVGLNGTLFTTSTYDDASRLTTITRGSSVFMFGYDNSNRRTSLAYPNGITTSYSYDDVSRLTDLTAAVSGATITQSAYTYDAVGNRLTKTHPEYAEGYEYDPLYRLTRVVRGTTNFWSYSYDAVGNRLTSQVDEALNTATYNDSNQLVSQAGGGSLRVRGHLDEPGTATVNGVPARLLPGNTFEAMTNAATGTNTVDILATDVNGNPVSQSYQVSISGATPTYTYDSNGNRTHKVEDGVTWTYVWDAENRLKWVCNTTPCTHGAAVASFQYDVLGRRLEKIAGAVTTTYTYDGENILRQIAGGTTLKLVHGPGIDEPLAQEDDGGALSYFHADGLGSIVKTTGAAGGVTSARRYDAFGNGELGAANGYAFTGREWDSETSLAYYRARYYDPTAARFLSEDPIGLLGGINRYAYVRANPTTLIDPTGLADSTNSWQLGSQWFTGLGPRGHSFSDGDPMTNQLRQHSHIQDRIRSIQQSAAAACGGCSAGTIAVSGRVPHKLSGLAGIPKYLNDYSTLLTFGATGNLAVTYLGSYDLAYGGTVDCATHTAALNFVVVNTSTLASALRPPILGYTSWWQRHIAPWLTWGSGPMSSTTQMFQWTERFPF